MSRPGRARAFLMNVVTGAAAAGAVLWVAARWDRPSSQSTGAAPALAAAVASPAPTPEVTPRAQVPEAARALTDAFAGAAGVIRPSVVRIDVQVNRPEGQSQRRGREPALPSDIPDLFRRFFDFGAEGPMAPGPSPVRGTGSGVILNRDGNILTNSHVVARAQQVNVTLVDGQKLEGKVVGRDPLTDIAVVRLVKKPDGLTLARMGDSEKLRVGQWVLAVGSPLGLAQTVTAGIVSGLQSGGSLPGASGERVRRYIQTDAAINPGNSGGPLVNLSGEVVGINTFINVGPGGAYGYAVAINQAAQLSKVLIKEGRVRYPFIGVQLIEPTDLPPEQRQRLGSLPDEGAVVVGVLPEGPAARAGLKEGDVIVALDGKQVTAAAEVVETVSSRSIGSRVTVEYQRGGQKQTATVTLAEMPSEDAAAPALGMDLQALTPRIAGSLGLDPRTEGVVVTAVEPGSPAEKAGLEAGDVIVEIDRNRLRTAEEASKLLGKGDKPHLLRVRNARGTRFVTIAP